ncbi:MAG TPA: DUF6622 family protein [Thermomicrobiaceae bacterium]|nr:DUF6622 family protein [Thermomicrobiaceae bacterium]
MAEILLIVRHTPVWVFAVLAVLVFFGVQALQQRTVPVWRLVIIPAVFIVWGVTAVVARSATFPILIVDWMITGAVGFAIGWGTTRLDGVEIDRAAARVQVPGSAVPLIRNLLIFAAKYCLAAAMALAPRLHGSLSAWDIAVSGLSAGYFVGWLVRFGIRYRKAPQPELASPT